MKIKVLDASEVKLTTVRPRGPFCGIIALAHGRKLSPSVWLKKLFSGLLDSQRSSAHEEGISY